jgi:hypothetical protein
MWPVPVAVPGPPVPGPFAYTPADDAPWKGDPELVDELPPPGIVVAFVPPHDWLGWPVPLGFPLAEAPPTTTANKAATTTIAVRSFFISSPFLPVGIGTTRYLRWAVEIGFAGSPWEAALASSLSPSSAAELGEESPAS